MLKTRKTKILVRDNGVPRLITVRSTPPRKYSYYAIEYSVGNERFGNDYFCVEDAVYKIERRLSEKLAIDAIWKGVDPSDEYGAFPYINRLMGYSTKEEAEKCIASWRKERSEKICKLNLPTLK